MTLYFRYVILAEVASYLWKGWTIDDDFVGCHHGRHGVLMRWVGLGEPD